MNPRKPGTLPVLLLFFLSGVAALVYEISWSRQIGLLFGHTVHAAAVTLGAYFGGMALGYVLAARAMHRVERPLLGYGIAELVVALWALVTPQLVVLLQQPSMSALISPQSAPLQLLLRALVSALILLPATAALGATLPLVAEHLSRVGARAGQVTLAYGLNTLGAFVGVVLATFVLLVEVGVQASGYIGAAASALCGGVAIWLGRGARASAPSSTPAASVERAPAARWYWVTAVSGGTTLALEVLYTRMFALIFHNSTYTFGVVVAVFLVALAAGGLLASRLMTRVHHAQLIGWAAALVALLIPASVGLFVLLTGFERFEAGSTFGAHVAATFGMVALIVLPPVSVLGLLLPITWAAAGGEGGSIVGRLTAVNTACAAAGSIVSSFVLLPLLGLWNSFALLALVHAALAFFMLREQVKLERFAGPALGGLSALTLVVGFARAEIGYSARTHNRLGHWESAYGWIDVIERKDNGQLDLKHNSRYRLSSSKLAHYEVRQGHIPLLLHPDPQRVLYLGLATGVTSSSALYHPQVKSAEIVELIPEVQDAARLFAEVNRGVVDADKVTLHINDARHHLHRSQVAYDVIVSDLFIPWESKTGYLYTVEHYRAARAHLRPGGHFCQWIHLWEVGARELELIADSLRAVFPHVTLWKADVNANVPVLGLIGSEGPLAVDTVQLAARLAAMDPPANGKPKRLRRPADLHELFVGEWQPRHPDFLNTDEHPRVEFLAPITQRRARMLKGARLVRYYRNVLMELPLSGYRVAPAPGQSAPDLARGRLRQLNDFGAKPGRVHPGTKRKQGTSGKQGTKRRSSSPR